MNMEKENKKIVNLIIDFLDSPLTPRKILRPTKIILLTPEELDKLVNYVIEKLKTIYRTHIIYIDRVEFYFTRRLETVFGEYEANSTIKLQLKWENGKIKLTRLEMYNSLNKVF